MPTNGLGEVWVEIRCVSCSIPGAGQFVTTQNIPRLEMMNELKRQGWAKILTKGWACAKCVKEFHGDR